MASEVPKYLWLSLGLIVCNGSAYAIDIPRTAEADIVRKQAESFLPSAPALTANEGTPGLAIEVPKDAEKLHFTLKNVIIEGSTVYHKKQLAAFYEDKIGKDITLADMYIAAGRITQKYLADGYVLSTAYLPQQNITDGVVRIRVVEGYVQKISLKGDPLNSTVAHHMMDRLLKIHPVKGRDIEAIMLMLNELPSVTAKASVLPVSQDTGDGAVLVQITITRKRISASLDFNDYASRYLGIWQSNAQAGLSGIFTPIDRLSLNLSSSLDPNFSHYERAEYLLPVNAYGTAIKFGASKSNSSPGYKLEQEDVHSNSDVFYTGITQPLIRTRAENLTFSTQFNLDSEQTDFLGQQLYNDRIRTLEFTTTYSLADAHGGTNTLVADFFKGLNLLDATKTGSDKLSRTGGNSDFSKLDVTATRIQDLGYDFSLALSSTGQWASDVLLASEEFGYGGPQFGRAYDMSEISSDNGVALSIELRYDHALFHTSSIQPYLFYDLGKVWSRVENIGPESAASAGAGFRTQISDLLHTDIYLAQPLTHTPSAPKLGSNGMDPVLGLSFGFVY